MVKGSASDANALCINEVRYHDKILYELALYLPQKVRSAAMAILAFHAEIAKTRSVVTETSIGLMRLLWWREAVQALYEGEVRTGQPVLESLHTSIKDYDLPLQAFEEMSYGYEFDLEDRQPSHIEGLETYFEATYGNLFKLLSQLDTKAPQLPMSITHCFGTMRLLRQHHVMIPAQHCLYPETLLVKHDLRLSDLYQGKSRDGIRSLVKECVLHAEGGLGDIKGETTFQKVLLAHLRLEINAFKAVDYDVFDGKLKSLPLLRSPRLWLCATVL